MASIQYQIQGNHTSGLTAKHYHGEYVGTLNEWARDNIPTYAIVSAVKVYYRGKVSTGDTKVYVGYSNDSSNEPGQKIISEQLKTSAGDGWERDIPSFQTEYPFNIVTSYAVLNMWASSGIIMKKYTCEDFRVTWHYYMPSYTVTVKAGAGGSVSGGGTAEAGTFVSITATPDKGYTFKQWNDGNTDGTRNVEVKKDITYTAEFIPKEYQIAVICEPSVSGEVCTVSGSGIYKYGDIITITATNIPPRHKIDRWFCGDTYIKEAVENATQFSVILTEETLSGFYALYSQPVEIKCSLKHTGYKICANIYPDDTAGYVSYIHYENGAYFHFGEVTNDGVIMGYVERGIAGLWAYPFNHYKFVKWSDGNTDNPRILPLTDDATYTAVFEKVTFKVTYKNADGTVLQETVVDYGDEQPPYTGTTPTLESTAEYEYIFLGWDSEISFIAKDEVIFAVYDKVKRKYAVKCTACPEEGGHSDEFEYAYGYVTTIAARPKDGYEFVQWEDGVTTPTREITVAGNATYTAIFRVNRMLGNMSKAVKLKFNLDEAKGVLLDHTRIYEKGN